MAAPQIPEYIDNQLNNLAAATGQAKDELIVEALIDRFGIQQEDRRKLSDFTSGQLERMDRSVQQLRRGEVLTGEEVSAKLKRWQKEFASR